MSATEQHTIFDQWVHSPGWPARVRVVPHGFGYDDIRYAVLVNAEGWGVAFDPDSARKLSAVVLEAAALAERTTVPVHVKDEMYAAAPEDVKRKIRERLGVESQPFTPFAEAAKA